MKEKLKNYFNKDRIFVFICLLCIIAFCVLYAILYANDKKQVSKNQSTIILNDNEHLNFNGILLNDSASYVYSYSSNSISSANGVIYDKFSVLGKAFIDDELTFSNYELGYEFYCLDVNDMISNDVLTITYYFDFSYDDISLDFTPIDSINFVPNIAFYFSSDPTQTFDFSNSSLVFDYDVVVSSENDLYNTSFTYCFNIDEFHNLNYSYFNIAFYSLESLEFNNTFNTIMLNTHFNCESSYNFTPVSGGDEELRQQYNTLLSQYNILNSQYNSLNSQFSTLNSQYSNLLSQYNILNNSNTSLQSQYDTLVASKNALQSQYDILVASKNTLQSQYDSLFSSYSSLSSSNSDLQSEMQDLLDEYNSIQVNYDILESNYNSLLSMYNNLTTDKYTFTELFWSISAVPFGILTSGFNVNILGFNLAAIITGLFTSLLLIWLIKKFFR